MSRLRVHVNKHGKADFLALLRKDGVEFEERQPQVGVVMASVETIEIIRAIIDPCVAAAVAAVIVTWLKGRASRSVMIQTEDNRVVHLKGYSEAEVAKILESATSVTAVQPKSDEV